jgi:APA family basic amino acid/polyamine antiporter
MSSGVFCTKNIKQTLQDTEEPEHQLKKNLGPWI